MQKQEWQRWLKQQNIQIPDVSQDEYGLYWLKDNTKKRVNWLSKYHHFIKSGVSKKQHKLLQAIYGRSTKIPFVLDACAGLGYDAFLMLLGGCDVIACEKNPQIFSLLANMLEDAKRAEWFDKHQMSTQYGCAIKLMDTWPCYRVKPDVVYLDPMFEKDFKGEVKANIAFIKKIVDVEETNQLIYSAMNLANDKVVIKRPIKAKHLSNLNPTYVLQGKTTRYDVYQV